MKKLIATTLLAAGVISAYSQGTVNFVNFNNNAAVGAVFRANIYGPEAGDPTVSKTGNNTADNPAGTQTYTGALLAGSGYMAQLYAANGSGAAESSLTAATPTTTFRTGAAAGLVALVTGTLNGVPLDAASATVQWRVWDNSSGQYADWASAAVAWNAGLIVAGKSLPFNVSAIGGTLNTPPVLANMQSFNLYSLAAIPEPSTFALAGLGAAALVIFRRRK